MAEYVDHLHEAFADPVRVVDAAAAALDDELDVEDPDHTALGEVEQLCEAVPGDLARGKSNGDKVDRPELVCKVSFGGARQCGSSPVVNAPEA